MRLREHVSWLREQTERIAHLTDQAQRRIVESRDLIAQRRSVLDDIDER
jgi:hypothetical protein